MLAATWFVLAGMAIVFAALGVLAAVMTVLRRLFAPKAGARARG